MISKEQIAHELAMIYMNNRYGINIEGSLIDGSGHIDSKHFPKLSKIKYKKIKTGEKGLFGIEKKEEIEDGYEVDPLFDEITETYLQTYAKFYQLLCDKEASQQVES